MASTVPEPPRRWPWHRRLAARYAATLVAVALGSTLLVAVPLYLLAAQLLENALDDRLEGTAELSALDIPADASARLAGQPDGEAATALRTRLATLAEEADLDAMYLATPDGTVRLAVGAPPTLTDADRRALALAASADATNTPIQADAARLPFLSAFAPTADPGLVLGVRASAPYLERLETLRTFFGLAGLAWAVGVALVGGLFGARLTRPIQRLLVATGQLAGGGTPAPPQPGGAAELDSLQEAFAAMAAAIRQREERLRALAGAVAHEVRNPSNALRLHLGLLRRDHGGAPPPAVAARLGVLERELDLLDATVDGFLVFAHDRAARRAPVALRALLERAASGADVQAPDATVAVDALLVSRAVANLVRNAREAGGEPVAVRAAVGAAGLTVEVEDAGPGFPPELVGRAFEPFVSGRVGGSGLGLAIVAAVAAAHGGTAEVAVSGPGRTVVVLRLPLPPG